MANAAWLALTAMAHNLDCSVGILPGADLHRAIAGALRRSLFCVPGQLLLVAAAPPRKHHLHRLTSGRVGGRRVLPPSAPTEPGVAVAGHRALVILVTRRSITRAGAG